jgi:ferritin-like metal-binding protein YciE
MTEAVAPRTELSKPFWTQKNQEKETDEYLEQAFDPKHQLEAMCSSWTGLIADATDFGEKFKVHTLSTHRIVLYCSFFVIPSLTSPPL